MKRLFPLFVIFVILFSGCSGFGKKYSVAIDPSFYPSNLGGQSENVYGFTVDLLKEISKSEGIRISYVNAGSESLLNGLRRNVFDAVITPKSNVAIESNIYSVSKNYFQTGPVLIAPPKSKLGNLANMQGKIVGVVGLSGAEYVAQRYSKVLIYAYTTPSFVMEALKYNLIDSALLDIMVARAFVTNLYSGSFEIVSKPLNDDGLYLVTMLNQSPRLIDAFNKGVKKAKRKGTYKELMVKWNISS
ncbi:MAG: putative histidine-binding protein [Chlamydiae bacterium]|nr:putative histidine-binding protein [Chlamydiota bacterium]